MTDRRLTVPTFALLGLTALTACSPGGSEAAPPQAADFRAGACRTAAPMVLEIGRQARLLGDQGVPAAGPLQALTAAQAPLLGPAATEPASVDPLVGPALSQLSAAVGLVRLRAVGAQYDASLGQGVLAAYDDVLQVCTGRALPTPQG